MPYQNLEKMSQSTTCGSLPIVIIICQPTRDDQDGYWNDKVERTLVKNVAYLTASGMDDWVGRPSNPPVG